ncbi:hypothetical protein MP228_006309 [Amoeboaphelidium protococcarum]|nr:hypothetical protein MP228_006309 [Amoeboaphelidium protococcarum]
MDTQRLLLRCLAKLNKLLLEFFYLKYHSWATMMYLRTLFLQAIVTSLVSGGSPLTSNIIDGKCAEDYQFDVDYFPDKTHTEKSNLFSVIYEKDHKIVHNKVTDEQYILYQCGSPKPVADSNQKVIQVPITSVSVLQPYILPYLELLGEIKAVKSSAKADLSSSTCLKRRVDEGKMFKLSYTPALMYEQLGKPEQYVDILIDQIKDPDNKRVSFNALEDANPVARLEWVKFLALFFNKEKVANQIFHHVQGQFECLKSHSRPQTPKPTVAIINYRGAYTYIDREENVCNKKNQHWYFESNLYLKAVIEAAGGKLYRDERKYESVSDFQAVLMKSGKIDVVIDMHQILSNEEDLLLNFMKTYGFLEANGYQYSWIVPYDQVKELQFIKKNRVFRVDKFRTDVGTDTFQDQANILPHLVVEDFIQLFHPYRLKQKKMMYLRNVLTSEQPSLSSHCEHDYQLAQIAQARKTCQVKLFLGVHDFESLYTVEVFALSVFYLSAVYAAVMLFRRQQKILLQRVNDKT